MLTFVIEYMYCHSLKIPAKYHGDRLNIFYVGSIFFLSYAILARLPLSGISSRTDVVVLEVVVLGRGW